MLEATLSAIRDVDAEIAARAVQRQATLTKPPGSLGRLESLAERVCAIQRTLTPSTTKRAVAVFAADHGVTAEGVSAYPSAVTAQMVANFAAGGAAICAFAKSAGASLKVVDVGVGTGTRNFAREPAMTRDEARRAIEVGITTAQNLDADLLGLGEMGIGNTTSAAALASVFCDAPPARVTGRGTGIDDAGLAHKVSVIERAIALHRPDARDPIGVLATVGGLEIAAIAGACLGAAAAGRVVIIDGFISSAGAMVAAALEPRATQYMVAAHRSVEPGHTLLLERLGLVPLVNLGMRLGEGTGAALAMPIIVAAVTAFREMATFESAGVENRS